MLNCPKCLGKLEEKEIEGVKVDVCWACEGIWFDKGELKKVIEADAKNLKTLDLDREEFNGKEFADLKDELNKKTGSCPRCDNAMKQKTYEYNRGKKLVVDVCENNCGLWLDGGEIHKLRDRKLAKWQDKLEDTEFKKELFFEAMHRRLFRSRSY